jgi:hypothetical protein
VKHVKTILECAVILLFASVVWQVTACELANYELQDEMKDIASLASAKIGLAAPSSDEDLRDAVVRKARSHNIKLDPRQIVVERSGTTDAPKAYIAVSYDARIFLPGSIFSIHFAPNSQK